MNGRAGIPWEERIELDVWYVDHRSPALDLRILARTARLLSPATGSTGRSVGADERTRAEVTLRDFRPADARAVHRWFNDERVTADLVGSRDAFSSSDADGLGRAGDRHDAATASGRSRSTAPTTRSASSRCSASTASSAPSWRCWSGEPAAWGKGVAREAERQACVQAFRELGAHRIHAEIPATNEAAQKVVTFLGFQRGGRDASARSAAATSAIDNQVWGLLPEDFTGWD